VVCVAAAGAIFFVYTKPTYDSVRTTRAEMSQYDEALQKAAELQQLKQTLLSRYNAFNPNDVDRIQKLLPDHVDNVRLILDLDSIASRNGMAIQNVVVSNPVSVQGAQTAIGSLGSSKQKYDSVTLSFSTQGPYETFLQFLTDLETSLRIVDLVSLTLTSGAAPTEKGQPSVYGYDVTIRTYWLK
jgi:Tfp pilus assembly protein PilO